MNEPEVYHIFILNNLDQNLKNEVIHTEFGYSILERTQNLYKITPSDFRLSTSMLHIRVNSCKFHVNEC